MARTKHGLFLVGTRSGNHPAIGWFPLVAGTNYYEGQVLRISATTGSATRMAAGGTCALGVLMANVASGSISATFKAPVALANADNIFEVIQITAVAPQTRVGDVADIAVGSTHNYRMSGTAVGATGIATAPLIVVGYDADESTSSHANCKFYVQFNNALFNGPRRVS